MKKIISAICFGFIALFITGCDLRNWEYEEEPNDDLDNANYLPIGQTIHGSINYNDTDYYYCNLDEGEDYQVVVSDLSSNFDVSLVRFYGEIYLNTEDEMAAGIEESYFIQNANSEYSYCFAVEGVHGSTGNYSIIITRE